MAIITIYYYTINLDFLAYLYLEISEKRREKNYFHVYYFSTKINQILYS